MSDLSRRQVLRLAALAGGGIAATSVTGACDTAPSNGGSRSGKLVWWDQFKPSAKFEEELFAEFAQEPGGMPVDYTVHNPQQMPEALQLAYSSKQMPDVFTLVLGGVPASAVHKEGWFKPLQIDDKHKKMLPEGALVKGKSIFDGKIYSLPIHTDRKYDALSWFNLDLFKKADLDPDNPPRTYDEFRASARAINSKGGDNVAGWIAPLQMAPRLAQQINQLAMAAGARTASGDGVDLRTGEYVFHSEPFVEAIEFWLALKKDKVLFPASSSLDARKARARWATGVAGFFFDGQYNIGVLEAEFQQFTDRVGVGPIVVPDTSSAMAVNQYPAGGTFWISSQSENAEAASRLISKFAEPEVQKGMAGTMSFPPLKQEYLQGADVHPTFRKAIELFGDHVYTAPDPIARNPAVSAVKAEMKPIEPALGAIIQGALSGDLEDWKGALKKHSDALAKERERAVSVIAKKGEKVGADDWRFADWEPGKDYAPE